MYYVLKAIAVLNAIAQTRRAHGRQPSLDLTCSRCAFEMRRPTATFAYIVMDPRTQKVSEVHWCPRHQAEVEPIKLENVA